MRLLLIEADGLAADAWRAVVRAAVPSGHDVVVVPTLSMGQERLTAGGIDAILMATAATDGAVVAAVRSLRCGWPQVPVVLLAASLDEAVGLEAVSAGAQDCLAAESADARRLWRVLRWAMVRQRLAEEQRERQSLEWRVQEAQRAESLEVLAGGVAHEFNNLLTGILGNVSMAMAELPAGSTLTPMLQEVQAAAQRAGRVTAQMLTYSGQGRRHPATLDLSRLLLEMKPLLEAVAGEAGRVEVRPWRRPLPVQGVAPELRQVVISLVTNAAEALPSTGGRVRVAALPVTLEVPAVFTQGSATAELPAGEYAMIRVVDNGRGIAAETLPRVFEPFFSTKFAGRGLGLASVLGMVRGHGGAISLRSQEGRGSTVEVLLPLNGHAAAAPATESPPAALAGPWEGLAVVVDDEPLIVSLVRKILSRHGLEVRAAADWEAALADAAAGGPGLRLVLMDADRPGRRAAAVLRSLRAAAPGVPVLLWGGLSDAEAEGLLQGFEGMAFVHKPFPPSVLLATVRSLLG